jgi:hypothetical protein
VLKSFWAIVDDVKRKPYELLDFTRNQYDRDYLEFNVNIHDLEISLQVGGGCDEDVMTPCVAALIGNACAARQWS